jgi:hypothetical protein
VGGIGQAAGQLKWRVLNGATAGRVLVRIVLAALAVQAVFFKAGADFQSFHRAGLHLLHREPLYRLAEDIPFVYLPVVAQWLVPWSLLPQPLAHALWVIASAAAFAVFFERSAREASLQNNWGACLLALALVLPFVAQELALGQSNAFLLLAMSQSESWRTKRPALSGLLWAVSSIVKPPYLLFALPALAWREWRRLRFLVAGIFLALALGALSFGRSYFGQFVAWREFISMVVPPEICAPDNQSLFAIFCTYVASPNAKFFSAGVSVCAVALIGVGTIAVRKLRAVDERQARLLATGLAFYATALVSPTGWQTNLIALLPVVFFLLSKRRGLALVALGVLAAADLLNYQTLGRVTFQRALVHRHYGIAALVAVMLACVIAWSAARSFPSVAAGPKR